MPFPDDPIPKLFDVLTTHTRPCYLFSFFFILIFIAISLLVLAITLLRWQNLLLTFILTSDKSKSESVLLSAIGLVAF